MRLLGKFETRFNSTLNAIFNNKEKMPKCLHLVSGCAGSNCQPNVLYYKPKSAKIIEVVRLKL